MRVIDGDRAPVMADVARIAGVSHQTVSRVLNGHPNVRPATRDRVLTAIRELGYRRNAAARTLVTRRTHTLGVISFDTTLYGPASMLYGMSRPPSSMTTSSPSPRWPRWTGARCSTRSNGCATSRSRASS